MIICIRTCWNRIELCSNIVILGGNTITRGLFSTTGTFMQKEIPRLYDPMQKKEMPIFGHVKQHVLKASQPGKCLLRAFCILGSNLPIHFLDSWILQLQSIIRISFLRDIFRLLSVLLESLWNCSFQCFVNLPTPGTRRSGQNGFKLRVTAFKNHGSTWDFFQKITSNGHLATRCCLFDYNGLLSFWLHVVFWVPDNARGADLKDFWSTNFPNWSQHIKVVIDHWSVSGDLIQSKRDFNAQNRTRSCPTTVYASCNERALFERWENIESPSCDIPKHGLCGREAKITQFIVVYRLYIASFTTQGLLKW